MFKPHEGAVPIPYFNTSEKTYINNALRMYRHIAHGSDADHIDTIAVVVSRDGILYEFQFWILWRAVLLYKLNFPTNPICANSELVVSRIFTKIKETINRYGLDNDNESKGTIR